MSLAEPRDAAVLAALALALALACTACAPTPTPVTPVTSSAPIATTTTSSSTELTRPEPAGAGAPEPERLEPVAQVAQVERPVSSRVALPVEGHPTAVVWAPGGDGEAPLVVATHGAGGTPEHACDFWHGLVGDRAFVLCPRGVTMDVYAPPDQRGFFYPAHPALEREVRAALAALASRFPRRVDPRGAIYVGFSQGATMGALAFSRAPAPFVAMALVEGGFDVWSQESALAFRDHGGKRVMFVCGRPGCAEGARRSARLLSKAGLEARLLDESSLPHAGHSLDGPVVDGAREAFAAIVGDDPRWAAPTTR